MENPEAPENSQATRRLTLDDATLKKIGFGKFNYVFIILSGLSFACVLMESLSVSIILPLAQCELNLSIADRGWLNGINLMGIMLASYFWGYYADKKGRKYVVGIPLMIAAGFSVLSSFSASFWSLLILRLLNGIFIAGPSAVVYVYLGEFHPISIRSKVLMYASVMYGISSYWYPLAATIILNQHWSFAIEFLGITYSPWRLFLIIISLPTFLCGLGMLIFVPESPKFMYSKGNEEEAFKILQYAYERNYGDDGPKKFNIPRHSKSLSIILTQIDYDKVSPGMFESMWQQTGPLFKNSPFKIIRASYLQFAIAFLAQGFYAFFPEIMQNIGMWRNDPIYGNKPATICTIISETQAKTQEECMIEYDASAFVSVAIMNTIYAVGWLILSFVIDMCEKKFTLSLMFCVSGASCVLLIFVDRSLLANVLYMAVVSLGLSVSVVNATIAELFPTQYRVMALTISLISGRLGGVSGALFIGYMIEGHCDKMFMVPAVLMGIAVLFVMSLPSATRVR